MDLRSDVCLQITQEKSWASLSTNGNRKGNLGKEVSGNLSAVQVFDADKCLRSTNKGANEVSLTDLSRSSWS